MCGGSDRPAATRGVIALRWAGLTTGMALWAAAVIAMLGRSLGGRTMRRCGRHMALALLLQQLGLALLLLRDEAAVARPASAGPEGQGSGACRLGLADGLTLSRGAVAALLTGMRVVDRQDREGPAGWLSWTGLLWGITASDWLDGALARRWGGASRLGPVLDLEMDSWLTLAAARLAVTWERVPRICLVAPLARYALVVAVLLRGAYGHADLGRAWWARASGSAQMAVLAAALAPSRWPGSRRAARALAVPVASVQLACLGALAVRLLRPRTPRAVCRAGEAGGVGDA